MNTAVIEVERIPGVSRESVRVGAGVVFSHWLSGNVFHHDVAIRVNGKWLADDDGIDFQISAGDLIQVFDRPKGGLGGLIGTILNPLEHLNPIKFTQKVLSSLMPMPNAATGISSKTSANNSVKEQTNIARNGEARPDNYGQIRSFPDLIQQSAFEYIDNEKYITELLNFGLGRYSVSSIRYSESNLGAMAGASSVVYQAGTVIPEITEVYQFDDIDGQELPGPNESDEIPKETASTNRIVEGEIAGGEAKVKIVKNPDFDYFFDLLLPHNVTIELNITYKTVSGNVTEDIKISAVMYRVEATDDGAATNPEQYYTFYFREFSGKPVPADSTVNSTKFVIHDNEFLTVGPFFAPLPGEQLWVHLNANLGDGDYANADITYWKLDDDNNEVAGSRRTTRGGFPKAGKTDYYAKTIKITPATGAGRYAIQLTRVENSNDHSVLKIESCHMVNLRKNVIYENDTIARVSVLSTKNATRSRDRKYNALITRHVISYDTASRKVDYRIRPSRRFADAVLHTWLMMGKQPEATIDIHGLYVIQQEIDATDERLGRFDYTFDDDDTSLGARISTICDAANVVSFWDNGILSFALDKKRDRAVTVLNRSNMSDDNFSLSYNMTLPGGFDGVEVKYRNPVTNKQDYVRYRITGSGMEKGEPNKAKKFDMLYLRDRFPADFRARRECLRLIHSNISARATTLADGEWLNVGDMVKFADILDINQQSGSITGRSGTRFEASERVKFDGEMFVVVTDTLGNATAEHPAQPLEDTEFGFAADIPGVEVAVYDGVTVQSPSRYIIAGHMEMDAMEFVVTEKKTSGSKTAVSIAEYSDLIYQ